VLKQLILKADRVLLDGMALRFRERLRSRALEKRCEYRLIVHYQRRTPNLVSTLCDKYGSDKGVINTARYAYPWPPHTYADFYVRLFDHCRLRIARVFECGLGTNNPALSSSMGESGKPGASLRVWRDYFPNAEIYGADIDTRILFNEERITTSYMDQTDPTSIAQYWNTIGVDQFDLMIDDGLHTFEAGLCLFQHSFARLRPGGIYVIEDVLMRDLVRYQLRFKTTPHEVDFVNLLRPNLSLSDNSLVVIRA
jgi:hypothetical protein